MTSMTMRAAMPPPLTKEEKRLAEERRRRLVAAIDRTVGTQAELHRRLIDLNERTSPATISKWCTGKYALTEVNLRGLLSVMGLPTDWSPDTEA